MDGPSLIPRGSSTLTSKLLEHGLADEVLLFECIKSSATTVCSSIVSTGSPSSASIS
jgi:hypothetical protein